MKRGLSDYAKKVIVDKMIAENKEELEMNGFKFSTKKVEGAIPTGRLIKGKQIYIHP